MRPVLQAEATECGIACLAMVAAHHGLHLELRELRQRFPVSLKGASLSRIITIADALGLQSRALRLDIEDLGRLQLPCMLHWGMNHFVVLEKTTSGGASVLDPAFGRRVVPLAEVSRQFTGVALELVPAPRFAPQPRAAAIHIGQVIGRIVGLKRALALVLTLSLTLQAFAITAPFLLQWVVDQVLVTRDRDLLMLLGAGFALILLLQVATSLLRGWAVVHLSARLGMQWMDNVFSHLLRLPLEFFEKRHLGDVTSRIASVRAIQATLTTGFVEIVIDGLMAVAVLSMMLFYSWKLALVSIASLCAYLAIRMLAFRPLRAGTEQQIIAAAEQQSHLLESIRGIQSLKVAGVEPARRAKYRNLMNDTINREVRVARLNLGFNNTSQLVLGGERVAVICIGALLVMQGAFSVGMLIAYLAYREQCTQRMSGFIDKCMELRMLRLHAERLADIVFAEPEPGESQRGNTKIIDSMRIEVRNLGFRYSHGDPWVLRNCSFVVEPGQSLAIVGASGCGKTTLVKLMLGLLKPSEGVIEIDGVDLFAYGPQAFRSKVGAVMQDDQLFAGNVAENIAFAEEGIDLERVEQVARLAAVHDDISAMPMGYHSLIGDMGTALSGGQKQRVILARALYRAPQWLFLDEATSHLDVERERRVNDAVRALSVTRIIVAHRPETIASADRVLVLDKGVVVDQYRPDALAREWHTERVASQAGQLLESAA